MIVHAFQLRQIWAGVAGHMFPHAYAMCQSGELFFLLFPSDMLRPAYLTLCPVAHGWWEPDLHYGHHFVLLKDVWWRSCQTTKQNCASHASKLQTIAFVLWWSGQPCDYSFHSLQD